MPDITYLDFDLEIEPAADGYRVEVNSPAGQSSSAFRLPFSELELENFLLKIGQSRRTMRRIDAPETEATKAFGARLFEALFAGEVRACLRSSIDEANRQNCGLRIRLRLNDTPELAGLPWEYLYNPAVNRFLALSIETPVVRYLELPERIRPLAVTPPLRVLALIASPRDQAPLNVEREWQRLREALGDLEGRGLVMLERLEQASLAELQRRLRRGTYHILHFVGHGGFDERSQDGQLLLEDEDGLSYRISGQDLGMLLHDHRSLRLAVLNSCDGARASRIDPFSGSAQSLVQQGMPAVIAMQFEVSDDAALALAREFYGALADGYPIDAALAEARKALFAAQSGVEWGTPVLYLRAADARIFDIAPRVGPPDPVQPKADPVELPERPNDSEDQLAPTLGGRATTIQGRLAAMGCQVNLLIQVAAVLVVLIGVGAVYGTDLFRSGGTSTQPTTTSAGGPTGAATPTALATATRMINPTAAPAPTSAAAPTAAATSPPAPTAAPTATGITPASFASWRELRRLDAGAIVNAVAFTADGERLAVARADRTVQLWRVADGTLVGSFDGGGSRGNRVTSIAFAPDGGLLAGATSDGTIVLWSTANQSRVRLLATRLRNPLPVQSVVFSHNGELLAAGGDDAVIRLWRVADGTLLRQMAAPDGHTVSVWGLAFAPDDKLLASGANESRPTANDRAVLLWRVADGALLRSFTGHSQGILSVAFSPDGQTLATGSWDQTVRLWNVASGDVLLTLEGHPRGAGSLAFSPDGRVLATAAGDGNARLWNVGTGQLLRAFEGHTSWASGVAFSPDGRLLASGSADQSVRLWGINQ